MDEFLNTCKVSGDAAYAALRSVLDKLEDPKTRTDTRIFLSELQKRFPTKEDCDSCFETYHFRIEDVLLDQNEGHKGRKKLTTMVIPSIFLPEDWSFTFFEGINRHPDSIFKDRTVAELGCGNGWISIAIADKWLPSKVYGLDINPRAIKISWINLYLNALDDKGQLIYDEEKKTLLDRVEFYESDLLSYCRENHIQLDRIVGCIPQILNPNPDAMSKMITENASEEFLHALSNYCALQGFVEDQFGLGLIARAVEEGISVIKAAGIMIFNMGGRPGQAVCKRLFERRGFCITKLWQTKILQAGDTDIAALVEIEKNSPHRFEFFMGLSGDQPICARTAWAYGKAGGRISHALSVYSCQLRNPTQIKVIFEFLKNGFQEISSSLDLSFEDDSVADEKIPFLAYLASTLKNSSYFPYEPPAGSKRFRNLIAGFLKTYHHIPLSANNVVIFPSRAAAIENALHLFSPRLAIVDEHLTRHLPRKWLTSLALKGTETIEPLDDAITVIEAPRQSDLLIELIKKLKPQVVVTGIAHFEAVTSSAFVHLLDTTQEIGSRLFLDISDHFELSSLPGSNGVLKYLSGTPLPSHAAIICGLVKNKVYPDLETAFVVTEEESLFSALSKTVELLEGNTSLINQYYYGCIFHELLAFQLSGRHAPAERKSHNAKSVDMIGYSAAASSVLDNAELSINGVESDSVIHMDVDQTFLPVPSPVKGALFESFARQNMSESEADVNTSIKNYVKSNYGFPTKSGTEFIYADNSKALFNKLVLCCIKEAGTLCFPAGSNGNYVSSARFLKADTVIVPTDANVGFKFTEKALTKVFGTVKNPWVYISGPTVNPTGLVYSNNEIGEILSTCAKFGARVIIDTSSSGLEFDSNGWDLEQCLSKLKSSCNPSFCVSLLGGLSLPMLNGVLKFGFLILNEPHLVDTFHSFPGLIRPHSTARYAIKKLLELRAQKPSSLSDAIVEYTAILKNRSKSLKEALEQNGWEVLESCAGVSVVAKPSGYLNKTVTLKILPQGEGGQDNATMKITLDDSNIRNALLKSTGLCINSGSWTGIPGYCRFNIALEESDFSKALDCIKKFKEIALH
ncbi:methionine S-methyltransferase-like isoform X1 [Arachis hypogaea]|uniref:methionine S-methyltransferase-like isoform X1 n=2 Tax=Arachis hypogaea TaxID=3818 RepID=UPI000DEC1C7A|nr:methionine S-methyltransferase-like isoform X1 [Arachis hypogaea]XP_025662736.1 methionine S-methyltransferase-like isoform X1 [Arachis hypogaea]QHO25935.1 Methionine S-methyltransferase [Arachis hypogaea]